MFLCKISKNIFLRYSHSSSKNLSREYLDVWKFLMEKPKFKRKCPDFHNHCKKVRNLLLTLLQVKAILAWEKTHLLSCTYLLISNQRKKLNRDTKHIMSQDQTYYCFSYLIVQKLQTQISQDKILLFHSILTSFAKVIFLLLLGWRQIAQQDMNWHSVSHFIFEIINFKVRAPWREEKIRTNFYGHFWNNWRSWTQIRFCR